MTRALLGEIGERDAQTYLETRGMTFETANWHCLSGELDLVMLDGEELVAVEVKARRGEGSGRAEESISASKARKLLAATEWFVAAHPDHHDRIWRIDLVAITYRHDHSIERVTHLPNAVVSG